MSGHHILGAASRLMKLRAMSLPEIADRLRYAAVLGVERQLHRLGGLTAAGAAFEQAFAPSLQGRLWRQRVLESRRERRSGFFSSIRNRSALRRLFETTYRHELSDTLKHAEAAREQRFEFFGRTFRYEGEIDWQSDPATGRSWPQRYHADVPVHGGEAGYGDVKYVWELNRQQYLIDLGKAYFLTGNEADLTALRRLVRSWIAGNPYATGVNWACALEPAFRVFSWLWAYHLASDALDDGFHVEWLGAFHDHGRFIARHLERYSSPYNHLIGEASALYLLAASFPEFRAAARWRALSRRILEHRLAGQFYPDGGSVEQSTFYHHATLGFYLLAALCARETGQGLSPAVWGAIERGIDFSAKLVQPDGRTPEIGGADDGKPIRMEHLSFWDFRPYQAAGAVLFARPDFKAVAGRFHEDALWLLGSAGLEAFTALESVPPRHTAIVLESSGYVVSRSDWSEHADYVCFDVGEQAAGMRPDGVPNSMHGHADCLSVIVWLGGRRVLVDSGLFAYNCGGQWEAHFRETAAHNTARVDGCDQARHIGKMAWSHSYRATLEGWLAEGRQSWAIGSHDGYARGANGVTHRRTAWLRPGYALIYDEFVGPGDHELEVNYQFAPGCLRTSNGGCAIFDDAAEVVWEGTGTWTAETRCGGADPSDGWICNSLGVRQQAPRLTLKGRTTGPRASLLTVLASPARGRPRVSPVRVDATSTLIAIAGEDHTDWVAAAGISPRSPIDTDALIAVCRMGPNGANERTRAGGTYLHVEEGALVRLDLARTPVCHG